MNTVEARPKITIALADDHTLFREGIKEMLTADPDIKIVGEAAEGNATVALALKRCPDILLLDVEMPGPGAASVIRQVSRGCPAVRIIVLTMHDDVDLVHSLLGCGAAAYLVKTILRDELIAAIRSVVRGSDTVTLSVSRHTIERFDTQRHGKSKRKLTNREFEVLQLIAQAFSNAQVASHLHIAETTVKRHLTNIYAKLNAVSRVDAIRKAAVARIISRVDT
jgi:DNA-binding NarL/FixJ family response regulator